ncbi:peptide chain release factor 3 [Patulibacter minatonensis]|uniref:peptide chain release factor 3 n=1 Tax=Patulibacter minatonensis TaxID=298163 RepID=UPI00047BE903|nr:peptide chain release factor 3 [Patulibacter minatonensis]
MADTSTSADATTTRAAEPPAAASAALLREAARRRTFAIISHPDAGKTTLTEKLLLYGGAVHEAGAVKARAGGRNATSDWMQIERERGISVSSTVLRFVVGDTVVNLLDTPGHQDFSEDTLRVLAAADCAVMVIDAAKGIEQQTRRLFQVARARRIPIITFVNKCDRPGVSPLQLVDHIEKELGLRPTPVTWPVGEGEAFCGVIDRRDDTFHRFTRTARGASVVDDEVVPIGDVDLDDPVWAAAREEVDLLDAVEADHDPEAFAAGTSTPLFFGSAVWNFGVDALLQALQAVAPAPTPWPTTEDVLRPLEAPFAGFVCKVQANTDPRHRDRIAYVRICSGRFERGLKVQNSRNGRPFTMHHAHAVFARERLDLPEAWPGDVIGVVGALDLRVGDTLHAGSGSVAFPPIPTIPPERFSAAHNIDARRHKQFRSGLQQLDEEGVVRLLQRGGVQDPRPILGGVGALQFEVASQRMKDEFGCEIRLETQPWSVARLIDLEDAPTVEGDGAGVALFGADGAVFAAFPDGFQLRRFVSRHPDVELRELVNTASGVRAG